MKTIVFATDFSANASHAAHFAGQLANDQKATIILVHAYQAWPDNPAKTGDFPLSVSAARETSEKKLQELARELSKTFGTYMPIRCIAQEGHARDVINHITKAEQADLLVMATIGTAPWSTRFMGSLATEMVGTTDVPVLLIPPQQTYFGLKKVVMGIDLVSPPNAIALDTALEFTRTFGSVLNILCISDKLDDQETQERADHIRHLLGQHHYTLTIEAKEGNIYDTLLTSAHHTEANMIMMLPQAHNWLVRLFSEGETQRLARLTDIPVLAVV